MTTSTLHAPVHSIAAEALRLLAAGISVIPIVANGTKRPAWDVLPKIWDEAEQKEKPTWKEFQTRRMTEAEAAVMFRGNVGISIVGGAISGNLGCLDFDLPGLYEQFEEHADDNGAGDLVRRLPLVETPSGGVHLRYRSAEPVGRCEKIATQSFPIPEGVPIEEKGKSRFVKIGGTEYPVVTEGDEAQFLKCVLETKNEGGLTVAPRSPAACHARNRPYVLRRGDLAAIPVLTVEEVRTLFRIASILDTYKPAAPERVFAPRREREPSFSGGLLPGEDFNERGMGVCLALLQDADWKARKQGQSWLLWRPGKEFCESSSATLNANDSNALYVFSSNAPIFEMNKSYPPFSIYAHLKFNGDFSEAARDLYDQNYGDRVTRMENNPAQASDEAAIPALISPSYRGDDATIQTGEAPSETAPETPSYRGDVATIQTEESAPDEIEEAVPKWILQLLGNLDAQVVDGRVCVSKNASAKAIVGGIRRLWKVRNTSVIQANYAMGVLAASLDGREAGASREDLINTHFGTDECREQIRRFVWVASQWSPTMIAQAIEKGFSWSNIVEASAKQFTVADRQRFMDERATVSTIRGEKAAKKGTPKYKTNAQLLRELETIHGSDELRSKLLALFPQTEEGSACGDTYNPYSSNATNADTEIAVEAQQESYSFDWDGDESGEAPPAPEPEPEPAAPADVESDWTRLPNDLSVSAAPFVLPSVGADQRADLPTHAVVSAAPVVSVLTVPCADEEAETLSRRRNLMNEITRAKEAAGITAFQTDWLAGILNRPVQSVSAAAKSATEEELSRVLAALLPLAVVPDHAELPDADASSVSSSAHSSTEIETPAQDGESHDFDDLLTAADMDVLPVGTLSLEDGCDVTSLKSFVRNTHKKYLEALRAGDKDNALIYANDLRLCRRVWENAAAPV